MDIKNLTFTFPEHVKPFFKNLHMHFAQGKLTALCGDNGSGKSTLLKILSGHLSSSHLEGIISLDGVDHKAKSSSFSKEFTQHMQLVHQHVESMLALDFTVHENLQLACLPRYPHLSGLPSINYNELNLQLPFEYNLAVRSLSGGQKQLLAIAMALLQKPRVLFLDEPTAALDTHNAHAVMQTLKTIAHTTQTTIVIICHSLELITQYADERIDLKR